MKLIDLIEIMEEYSAIKVTPSLDMEWDAENPCFYGRVSEITYKFVKAVGKRDVTEITACFAHENGEENPCISVRYSNA